MDRVNPDPAGKPIGQPEAATAGRLPVSLARGRPLATFGLLLLLAWLGSGLHAFTIEAQAAVLLPAAVLTVIVMRRASAPIAPSPPVRLGFRWWGLLLLVGLLWEAYAFLQQPTPTTASVDHPTLSVLFDPLMEHRTVRVLAWFVWLYVGYRLFASLGRSREPSRSAPSDGQTP